ncbi:MAG: phosphate acetyltransferase [Caldicoprobacterales bacterium]|jgi:phosphate acetyltransferase|nr:phosphate acetyltransferase [Clostridiales bacterium]
MSVLKNIRERAAQHNKTIVLPEGNDDRIIEAAAMITNEGIAKVIVLGNPEEITQKAKANGWNLTGVQVVDHLKSDKMEHYVKEFTELRKSKGMTIEQATEIMKDPLYFGAMMVKLDDADGMTAGAVYATSDVLRPAFQIIKTAPGIPVVSSCFIIEMPDAKFGANGAFVYGDCGVNPDPDAQQLGAIAVSTAMTMKQVVGYEPIVALLSYSTKGSAEHPRIDKVREATRIAREMAPQFLFDGELQGDAALVEDVAKSKAPGSKVAGRANVLVFPDLDSGNIAYKLTQRLAGAEAVGPICQGLAKPVNDLSRGCNATDIMNAVAVTVLQSVL